MTYETLPCKGEPYSVQRLARSFGTHRQTEILLLYLKDKNEKMMTLIFEIN